MNLCSVLKQPSSPGTVQLYVFKSLLDSACCLYFCPFIFVCLYSWLSFVCSFLSLAQLTFIEFLLFVPHSVFWQVDCLYLSDSAFFVVVGIPQCTLLSDVRFYHITKFFLLVKILSFGLNSPGIKSVCGIFVEFRMYFYCAWPSPFKQVNCLKIDSFVFTEQKPSNVKSQRAQCVGTLRRWTF